MYMPPVHVKDTFHEKGDKNTKGSSGFCSEPCMERPENFLRNPPIFMESSQTGLKIHSNFLRKPPILENSMEKMPKREIVNQLFIGLRQKFREKNLGEYEAVLLNRLFEGVYGVLEVRDRG